MKRMGCLFSAPQQAEASPALPFCRIAMRAQKSHILVEQLGDEIFGLGADNLILDLTILK